MIIDFGNQLLSALEYLHYKNFFHAPGEINSYRVFFSQMYDQIFLDIRKNSDSIAPEWINQNAGILLRNRKYYFFVIYLL